MKPCRFSFTGIESSFEGYDHGTKWNGYANVSVTPEVRDAIAARLGLTEELAELPVGDDGLVSLANGWTAEIV